MILQINGKKAERGMKIETTRGEVGTLMGWREPHKPSSSGKVHVQLEGNTYQSEFFPGVISGEFVKVIPKITYLDITNENEWAEHVTLGPFEEVHINVKEIINENGKVVAFHLAGNWYVEGDEDFVEYTNVKVYSK